MTFFYILLDFKGKYKEFVEICRIKHVQGIRFILDLIREHTKFVEIARVKYFF